MANLIVNIEVLCFEGHGIGEQFAAQQAPVASVIGARQLGYRVAGLPPGKRAWPFHSHCANEEMFFVLDGTGALRFGDRQLRIRAGDFIAAPAGGGEVAHPIINTSASLLKYLCVSTMIEPDVGRYPDSGKFGAYAGAAPGGMKEERTFVHFGYPKDAVAYWDEE